MLLTDETEVCGFRDPEQLEETLQWPPQPPPSHYSCIHSVNMCFVSTVCQALSWVPEPWKPCLSGSLLYSLPGHYIYDERHCGFIYFSQVKMQTV